MRKVFIKYNPYKLETEVLIDGKEVKRNSRLNVMDKRLQEWVDDLPEILREELSTKEFEITFHGTALDYEDVLAVANEASKRGIKIEVKHIPAKEVKDKYKAISDIFEEIQKGPFEELRQPGVIKAFEQAKSSDFEVNVVATMSAGKSTLINALLGQKLMPAKQEACTAIIAEIKDNDMDHFEAKVYDKGGNLIETQQNLTYDIMSRLNSDEDRGISKICIEGNIPFVNSDDVSLVLVDTPGPNNSRDPEHKKATYRMLSESSKMLVLYVMNASQLAVDDDNNLLKNVAESMKVGGKQSRDRFIFVVNKLDGFRKGEDSVESSLEKVRDYLTHHKIENPNIYPASALTALDIRTTLKESDDDNDDEVYAAKGRVRKFNRDENKEMHFENYAPLPAYVRGNIANRLEKAKKENDDNEQALIHCGIVPIEEAIRMYVLKYAKTAKIKNIVDTFIKSLESAESFETAKEEISSSKEEREAIFAKINKIESKLQSGEDAKKFKTRIDSLNYDEEIKERADSIIEKAQKEYVTPHLTSSKERISRYEAENICRQFERFAKDLKAEVQVKLEELIENNVKRNAEDMFSQYKDKLADLMEEIDVGGIYLDPFEIMKGEIYYNTSEIISDSTRTETVKVGEKWIKNTNKKWYKPWTWFEESGHYEDIYEDREYIEKQELSHKFFAPIQESLYINRDSAVEYAEEQTKIIKFEFSERFDELDRVLTSKLNELKECATDEEKAKKKLKEAQERLAWLEEINGRVNAILEI